jgi:hypothetical protein
MKEINKKQSHVKVVYNPLYSIFKGNKGYLVKLIPTKSILSFNGKLRMPPSQAACKPSSSDKPRQAQTGNLESSARLGLWHP